MSAIFVCVALKIKYKLSEKNKPIVYDRYRYNNEN